MLDDSSSEQCVMKEKKDDGGLMFMCSCTGEECNDVLIFSASEFNNFLFILGLCLACDIKSDIESNGPWNCLLWRKTSRWLEAFWPLLRLQNLSLSFVLSGHISSCQAMFLLKQFRYSSQHMALESHLNVHTHTPHFIFLFHLHPTILSSLNRIRSCTGQQWPPHIFANILLNEFGPLHGPHKVHIAQKRI